jgi:hypothetical protein
VDFLRSRLIRGFRRSFSGGCSTTGSCRRKSRAFYAFSRYLGMLAIMGSWMPLLHGVWDTNIYRTLGTHRLLALRNAEREQGISPRASYWCTLELAVHVADSDHSAHRSACASLRALWEHTHYDDGGRFVVPLVADTENQLACQANTWGMKTRSKGVGTASTNLVSQHELARRDSEQLHLSIAVVYSAADQPIPRRALD